MRPEQQRIAIAEACGWLVKEDGISGISPINRAQGLTDFESCSWILPDYLNDLNAMHEAEKVLTENQWDKYEVCIEWMTGARGFRKINATAAQRAEAFLRTLNLWKS
jgi:hypothetical protein